MFQNNGRATTRPCRLRRCINGGAIAGYAKAAEAQPGVVGFLMDIIPTTLVDAFAKGATFQVILISVLLGLALVQAGERGRPLVGIIDSLLDALFRIVSMVMRLAPTGAGAGVAYTDQVRSRGR